MTKICEDSVANAADGVGGNKNDTPVIFFFGEGENGQTHLACKRQDSTELHYFTVSPSQQWIFSVFITRPTPSKPTKPNIHYSAGLPSRRRPPPLPLPPRPVSRAAAAAAAVRAGCRRHFCARRHCRPSFCPAWRF